MGVVISKAWRNIRKRKKDKGKMPPLVTLDYKSEEVQDTYMNGERALVLCSSRAFKPLTGETDKIPTVYLLLRHAEAEHNVRDAINQDDNIIDPPLTAYGKAQCATHSATAMQTPDSTRMLSITHIVSSPQRRALQTALLYFAPLLASKPDLKIFAMPNLKERGWLPSSTGTDLDVLKEEFKNEPVDFSWVRKGWEEDNLEQFHPQITRRGRRVREELFWVGEGEGEWCGVGKYVAVVSHGGILQHITETDSNTHWKNCAFQEFRFKQEVAAHPNHDKNFSLERIPEVQEVADEKFGRYLEDVLGDKENTMGCKLIHLLC